MMHVGRGREHPLHIEYVHIGVCLAFIQDILTEALLSHPRIKMDKKIALIKALGKVIWIQNDLFAKWYVRDGDEYLTDVNLPEFEQEGYLDGKKVLDDIEEGDDDGDSQATPRSPRSPTTCPFSGIPIRSKVESTPPKADEVAKPEEVAVPEPSIVPS